MSGLFPDQPESERMAVMKHLMQNGVKWLLLAVALLPMAACCGCASLKKEEPQKFETMQDFLSAPKPESPNARY